MIIMLPEDQARMEAVMAQEAAKAAVTTATTVEAATTTVDNHRTEAERATGTAIADITMREVVTAEDKVDMEEGPKVAMGVSRVAMGAGRAIMKAIAAPSLTEIPVASPATAPTVAEVGREVTLIPEDITMVLVTIRVDIMEDQEDTRPEAVTVEAHRKVIAVDRPRLAMPTRVVMDGVESSVVKDGTALRKYPVAT